MPTIFRTLVACLAILAPVVSADPADEPRTPVLLELFTSEGCSSCPPADEHVARLVRVQPLKGVRIVALSEHVDYWDSLGWRDPFSSTSFSERQRDYARRFGGGVYTPQLVVDGQEDLVGSDRSETLVAIRRAAKRPKVALELDPPRLVEDSVEFGVTIGEVPAGVEGNLVLWTALAEDGLVVDVERGENSGRELRHDGVARDLRPHGKVGSNQAREVQLDLDEDWNRDHLRVVAFLVRRANGAVVGVATAEVVPVR